MNRAEILDEAKRIITTDRESDYGKPENTFQEIADYWSVYLQHKGFKGYISAADVAKMMSLLKLARMKYRFKSDNFVDMAGYTALAYELEGSEPAMGEVKDEA